MSLSRRRGWDSRRVAASESCEDGGLSGTTFATGSSRPPDPIIMDSPAIVARKELTELGILEDSGERRPGKNGGMQVMWRLSALGLLVGDYQKHRGLTQEQALAKARASGGSVRH